MLLICIINYKDYSPTYNYKVTITTDPIYVSNEFRIEIDSYDDYDNRVNIGGRQFKISLINFNNSYYSNIIDHENGTYTAKMICFQKGNFSIDVSFFHSVLNTNISIPDINFTNSRQIKIFAYLCHPKFSIIQSGKKILYLLY